MSKFNTVATYPTTVNHEGSLAYYDKPEYELLRTVANSLLEDKFYESSEENKNRIKSLVDECSQDFVLKLASYARNFLNLRSAPIYLLVLSSLKKDNRNGNVRTYVPKIIRRADELSEVVAAYISISGSKNRMPNALRRGIADAFLNFKEYDFSKYKSSRNSVKLSDVVKIVHPKPKDDEQSDLYKRIIENKLTPPRTWEVVVSAKGSNKETWNAISEDMGFMALLRNLRNFEIHSAEKAISISVDKLTNASAVANSKQFPFRFLSAFKNVTTTKVKDALRTSLELSVSNIPKIEGKSALLLDVSGSMHFNTSRNTNMKYYEIALLMGAMANKICSESIILPFATTSKFVELSNMDTVLTNQEKLQSLSAGLGGGTNGWHPINNLIENNIFVDRIMVFSDCQMTGEQFLKSFDRYKSKVNNNAKLFIFDLAGYRTSLSPDYRKDIYTFSGWSDKMLQLMIITERGFNEIEFINEAF